MTRYDRPQTPAGTMEQKIQGQFRYLFKLADALNTRAGEDDQRDLKIKELSMELELAKKRIKALEDSAAE